ncbi:acyl-CoA dehydrogenase family protein [Gordonia sp. (in: high G+C Gram-positive bacteria)]|uniref:acyl-CoA dehydrogenase family protein n=1 Tax=Gordonia sp. (in: high G+C Gram-positive bacteria) TaxID=84139 RepID=UPI003C74076F
MDFTPTEAATDLAKLTADIVNRISPADRVAELESANAPIDERLWAELAGAGLLGLAAPESAEGAGLTTLETVAVATELGRGLARVPFGPHAVAGVPVVTAHGSDELVAELLTAAATGGKTITVAVEEDRNYTVAQPRTVLDGASLSGTNVNVPYAAVADVVLVSAATPDGAVVVAVPVNDANVTITETRVTGLTPAYTVEFNGVNVPASHVLGGGAETVAKLVDLLRLAICADQEGATSAALAATAEYAREREQFGRAIGSFQAVAQRLADAFIDIQGLSLTTTQAAWLLSGLAETTPGEATIAVNAAKFWAAEAGHRVAHTAVHVHGGVGLDTTHTAHRYFLRAKQNEFTLGNAPVVLDELGDLLAAQV